jgi:predicted CopG family antitoxin
MGGRGIDAPMRVRGLRNAYDRIRNLRFLIRWDGKQLIHCVLLKTCMPLRTVTLAEDAYEALKARKEKGESFSDVVRRLSGSHPSLMEFAGAWKNYPADRMKEFEDWLSWNGRESVHEMKPPAPGRRRARRG